MRALIDSASTQSRARRPLPDRAIRAVTTDADGALEWVKFTLEDGTIEDRELLTWIGGQAGLLWGAAPKVTRLFGLSSDKLEYTHGSYGHEIEHALADLLAELFEPYIVNGAKGVGVRFFQNGGDACAAAARLCRAETGKQLIATQGYHGAQDCFGHWTPAGTLPAGYLQADVEKHRRFKFRDYAGMHSEAYYSACLMLEVPGLDDEAQIADFLKYARHTADEVDIPLVIDDVVGGFRFGLRGSCERYNVQADLICLGKAMSATGKIAALVGRLDLMEGFERDVFYSTTFGGDPGACAVALATIEWLKAHRKEVYGPEGHLQKIGRALKDGLNAIGVPVAGQPERSAFAFPNDDEWLRFCRGMIGQGVMVHRPNFPTLAHTLADVERTIAAARMVRMIEIGEAKRYDSI